jgi:hypothetical protein
VPPKGAPKSGAGDRTIAPDAVTVADIRRHRREQGTERNSAGDAWVGSGFEFTDEHGGPPHSADVTYAFHLIAYVAGLLPVRLPETCIMPMSGRNAWSAVVSGLKMSA